jgi:hypothetical protein
MEGKSNIRIALLTSLMVCEHHGINKVPGDMSKLRLLPIFSEYIEALRPIEHTDPDFNN